VNRQEKKKKQRRLGNREEKGDTDFTFPLGGKRKKSEWVNKRKLKRKGLWLEHAEDNVWLHIVIAGKEVPKKEEKKKGHDIGKENGGAIPKKEELRSNGLKRRKYQRKKGTSAFRRAGENDR